MYPNPCNSFLRSLRIQLTFALNHTDMSFQRTDCGVYMTVHQQDSSQPQQSQDSPHLGAVGLTMVEMEEATLAGILKVGCEVLQVEC